MKLFRIALLTATLIAVVAARAENPFTALKSPFEPAATVLAAPDADAAWKPLPGMSTMDGLMAAITGKKTILQFLSKPIVAMRENAFRER